MQLHELRSHPVIKYVAYAFFAFIIISFVFFYGWQSAPGGGDPNAQTTFARYQSDSLFSFLPWKKWEYITAGEVRLAQDRLTRTNLGLLGPQIAQFYAQQGRFPEWLAPLEDAVAEALDQRLLVREAEKRGIVVTPEDVNAYIRDNFTRQSYQNRLSQLGMSDPQYRTYLRQEQMALRARDYIGADARVSLFELWQDYLLVNEEMKLRIAPYSVERFAEEVEATDEQLQEYLEAHHEEFRVPAKRRFAYAMIERGDTRDEVDASEENLLAFYQQNEERFRREETATVEDIFAPVNDDQPTTAAQRLIGQAELKLGLGVEMDAAVDEIREQNPDARLYFRDLGEIGRNPASRARYGEEYIERVFAMSDDALSTPVQTNRGFFLIHRLDSQPAGLPAFEEIRSEVEEAYISEKTDELFSRKIDELRDEARRFTSVRDFAQSVGLDDGLTTAVQVGSPTIPEIGALGQNANYVWNLRENQLSELVVVGDRAFVLQVVQAEESHLPELSEVREDVEAAYRREQARETAEAAARAALEEIRLGAAFDEIVQTDEIEPIETDYFTRLDPIEALDAPLLGFLRETARIVEGSTGVSPYGPSEEQAQGYALWKIDELRQPEIEEFREDRRAIERDALQLREVMVVEEWLADQRRKVDFELLNQ